MIRLFEKESRSRERGGGRRNLNVQEMPGTFRRAIVECSIRGGTFNVLLVSTASWGVPHRFILQLEARSCAEIENSSFIFVLQPILPGLVVVAHCPGLLTSTKWWWKLHYNLLCNVSTYWSWIFLESRFDCRTCAPSGYRPAVHHQIVPS